MIYIIPILFSLLYCDISDGYTLFSPLPDQAPSNGYSTYLIDNSENIVNTWTHDCKPVTISYLLPDSSIVIPCTQDEVNGLGGQGQSGGRILKLSWDGDTLWDDIFVEDNYEPHHDIEPLPNGNILFITYERKTFTEAALLGRVNVSQEIWPSYILELQQVNQDSSAIVWEWHLWDHTIQDVFPDLFNFGNISENPGKFDINLGNLGGGGGASGDWLHLNAIDYNESLDLIAISSRKMNEFYFIDHSTTTLEASSDSGGNFNQGGNFIYRWGNSENYNRGDADDQILLSQHSVNWIDPSHPGGGDIILFNNRTEDVRSEVLQISTPVDSYGYEINSNDPHLPIDYTWRYGDGSFFSNIQSGAFRLENGNTLISLGNSTTFFEIDSTLSIVWEYNFTGPSDQEFNGKIPRYQKYHPTYFTQYLLGDLNSDLIIDILDVLLAVDIVVNGQINDALILLIDMNFDENIDILDILLIVDIILNI